MGLKQLTVITEVYWYDMIWCSCRRLPEQRFLLPVPEHEGNEERCESIKKDIKPHNEPDNNLICWRVFVNFLLLSSYLIVWRNRGSVVVCADSPSALRHDESVNVLPPRSRLRSCSEDPSAAVSSLSDCFPWRYGKNPVFRLQIRSYIEMPQ